MSNYNYIKKAFMAIASAFLLLATGILLKMGTAISLNYILLSIFYFLISAVFGISVILVNEVEYINKKKKKKR